MESAALKDVEATRTGEAFSFRARGASSRTTMLIIMTVFTTHEEAADDAPPCGSP